MGLGAAVFYHAGPHFLDSIDSKYMNVWTLQRSNQSFFWSVTQIFYYAITFRVNYCFYFGSPEVLFFPVLFCLSHTKSFHSILFFPSFLPSAIISLPPSLSPSIPLHRALLNRPRCSCGRTPWLSHIWQPCCNKAELPVGWLSGHLVTPTTHPPPSLVLSPRLPFYVFSNSSLVFPFNLSQLSLIVAVCPSLSILLPFFQWVYLPVPNSV